MQDARIEIFRSSALIITFTYIITEETKNNIITTKYINVFAASTSRESIGQFSAIFIINNVPIIIITTHTFCIFCNLGMK